MQKREVYEYSATVVRVKDGDTVVLRLAHTYIATSSPEEIDFGFYIRDNISYTGAGGVVFTKTADITFRLNGLNAPEVHGVEKSRGELAKAELVRLLSLGTLRVMTSKMDKFGRWLADIYVKPADGPEIHVNKAMIDEHFALPWDGQGEKPVTPEAPPSS